MGTTLHGIKYPEMPDLPNVPDDIGGLNKLDQTAQAWLALLDNQNTGSLAFASGRAAYEENYVATTNTSITTAVNQQSAQQSSVNAIVSRNTNAQGRLDSRDATLATDSSAIQGFTGRLANLNTQKGRGCIGYTVGSYSTTIPINAAFVPIASVTFNDPSPSASRMYRGSCQCSVNIPAGSGGSFPSFGVAAIQGTSTGGTVLYTSVLNYVFMQTGGRAVVNVEGIFTGITAAQWTLWMYGVGGNNTCFVGGDGYSIQTLCLEDIGLQL